MIVIIVKFSETVIHISDFLLLSIDINSFCYCSFCTFWYFDEWLIYQFSHTWEHRNTICFINCQQFLVISSILPQAIVFVCPNLIDWFSYKPAIGGIVIFTISQFYYLFFVSREGEIGFPGKVFGLDIYSRQC